MGRKSAPIEVVVHYPTTEEGKRELAERVAEVHADFVLNYVRKLQIPSWQKEKLIDAVIKSAKERLKDERKQKRTKL
jgi:predicted transcriptional regulator